MFCLRARRCGKGEGSLGEKMVIDPDRYRGNSFWRRFPGLNAVTLISSVNQSGETEVIFRGLGMPFDGETPYFLLTCAANSPLYKNISQWGEFVVNFPGTNLMDKLHFWALNFPDRLLKPEEVGLKTDAAQLVKPGRIQECYAHLECRLEREIFHQGYIMIVGKILAGYLDRDLVGNSGELGLMDNLLHKKMVGYVFPFGYSLVDRVDYVIDNP